MRLVIIKRKFLKEEKNKLKTFLEFAKKEGHLEGTETEEDGAVTVTAKVPSVVAETDIRRAEGPDKVTDS